MENNIRQVNIEDYINVPKEMGSIAKPKIEISKAIGDACRQQEISIRKLAANIGLKHPQIVRITSGDYNYNIDTLLKVLDGLNLEISIRPKNK